MGGVGCARASIPAHPVQISRSFLIALNCALYVSVGISFIAPDIVLSPWRIRYSGVMVGVVMNLWRNSIVSEKFISRVSAVITNWQR